MALTPHTTKPVQSRLPFQCNLHPPYHVPPPPQPWGHTQHRAPACFIDAQDARLLAAHCGHRRVQAAAARIVSLQLSEIHAASAATTRRGNRVCRRWSRRAFSAGSSVVGPDQSARRTRPQPSRRRDVCAADADAAAVGRAGNCSSQGPPPRSEFEKPGGRGSFRSSAQRAPEPRPPGLVGEAGIKRETERNWKGTAQSGL